MWIDSHCHLNHSGIHEKGTPADIIAAAKAHGVAGMMTISCRIAEEHDTLTAIAAAHDNVWCSVGTHPHDAGCAAEKAITQAQIADMIRANPKAIAIGETGLDYFYDNAPRDDQATSFRKHCRAARDCGVPVIIHTREAEDDTATILEQEGAGQGLTGVMHCFSSAPWLAEKALEMGFYISFSGMVTFKKSDALRAVAKTIPLDRVLVETDAPFLAPMPYRGKVNEPAYVAHTGAYLAELYNMSIEDFAAQTTENFYRLFTKAQETAVAWD